MKRSEKASRSGSYSPETPLDFEIEALEMRLAGDHALLVAARMYRRFEEWIGKGGPEEPFEDENLNEVFNAGVRYAFNVFADRIGHDHRFEYGLDAETQEDNVEDTFVNIIAGLNLSSDITSELTLLNIREIIERAIDEVSS